jgi:hypothetical protein
MRCSRWRELSKRLSENTRPSLQEAHENKKALRDEAKKRRRRRRRGKGEYYDIVPKIDVDRQVDQLLDRQDPNAEGADEG